MMSDQSDTRRVRIDLAYDGTDFQGWAAQPGRRTVQGVLEDALALILRQPVRTVVAGRTDAGVHATGQVVHADVPLIALEQLARTDRSKRRTRALQTQHEHDEPLPTRSARVLCSRLRSVLGRVPDLLIRSVRPAAQGFDARFSPMWRRYEYRVSDEWGTRDPLLRRHVLAWPQRVDVARMNRAAHTLLGLHDWAAYCRPRAGATTIRELQRFSWRREPAIAPAMTSAVTAGGILVATVQADAFCHHMVRCLVGATLAVGGGDLEIDDLVRLRDEGSRGTEYKMVPGHGLVLAEVGYPSDADLATRAEQTRARRDGMHPGGPESFSD
ncbi:tRNA pseudouridine synthase A [Pseudoclavibacter sp. 13-3]|uniref:tRNA pseudouridine synthase A n=1 Tax=Pseudoclavibacter sp. 13-3 TaxID=2901228 RepID=UPI001E4DC493|nr:tRNA pseudouridine synthase A [Pseudoclavibacter sp. 13-3]MCD7101559.1 tRNA pseudouridine synthase A [Pseudoclavibacter sp. 13-3]